jgi:hypothetical protein
VKRLIAELPMCAHLAARKGQRDSSLSFDVGPARPDHSPSVKSVGITGQITGSRADIIIPDDVEVPGNSLTQLMRDRLATLVREFDAVLKPLETSRIIYLGTPQTEMTLYRTLEGKGYTTRIWPARFPTEEGLVRYGPRLAPMITSMLAGDASIAGTPTDPMRFGDLDLREREASYGRSGFALQFQLDPSASDANKFPLKLNDLMTLDLDPFMAPIKLVWGTSPELVRNDLPTVGLTGDRLHRPMWLTKDNYVAYQGVAMAIDPAGRGSDELAYAIVAMLNGYLFVLRCRGLTGGYSDENLQKLADEARLFKVNHVRVESNFGDGMFEKLLAPFMARTWPVTIEGERSSVQKERRIIDTLEPVMNQHRLVVDSAVIREDHENYNSYHEDIAPRYQLMYQLTRITREKGALSKDDRLDALAMAVAYWVEELDKDTERIEKDAKEALREAEFQKFMDQFGVPSRGDSMLDAEFDLAGLD